MSGDQQNQFNYLQPFDNKGVISISKEQLPLSCPLPNQAVWNAHPRVYLPILEAGEIFCPYCNAHYILEDFEKP